MFQALLLTFQITAGLTIMDEIRYYGSQSLTGIFFSALISWVGISVIVLKKRLEDDDDFQN